MTHPAPNYDGATEPAHYEDPSVMGRIVQDLVSSTFENTSMRIHNGRAEIELEWTRDEAEIGSRIYRALITVSHADDVTAEVEAAEDDWRESIAHQG